VLEEREDGHLFEEAIDELAASAELLSASVDRSPKSQPHQCAERSRLPAITSTRSSVHLILSGVHLLPVSADCINPKFPFFKVSVHLPKPKFPLKTVDTDCFRSKFPLLEVNVHLRKPKFHLNKVNASFAHPNADEIKEKFRQIKVNAGPAVRLAAPSRPPSAPPIPFAGLPLAPIAPRAAPFAPRVTVALPLLAVSASFPPPAAPSRAAVDAALRAIAWRTCRSRCSRTRCRLRRRGRADLDEARHARELGQARPLDRDGPSSDRSLVDRRVAYRGRADPARRSVSRCVAAPPVRRHAPARPRARPPGDRRDCSGTR
jgi:hypothetical protein